MPHFSFQTQMTRITQINYNLKFRKLNFLEFRNYFPSVSRKSLLILTLRYGQEFYSLCSSKTSFDSSLRYGRFAQEFRQQL